MSKSLKLYAGTAIGILGTLTLAVNFADRFVADFPENPRTMAALPAPEPVAEAPSGVLVGAATARW